MLSKDQQNKIAELLSIKPEDFASAVSSEKEVAVKLPENGKFYTNAEIESRDKNVGESKYSEGKIAGQEILIKDWKKENGLEYDGKDPSTFLEKYRESIEKKAGKEPNDQLKEKDGVIAKLRSNITELTEKNQSIQSDFDGYRLNSGLITHVPAINPDLGLEKSEVISSMKAKGYSFEQQDGKVISKINGEVVRDSATQDALDAGTVIGNYVVERKWNAPEGRQGRGGGNSNPRGNIGITTLSQAEAKWKADGKSTNTSEFQAYIGQLSKENEAFDLDS